MQKPLCSFGLQTAFGVRVNQETPCNNSVVPRSSALLNIKELPFPQKHGKNQEDLQVRGEVAAVKTGRCSRSATCLAPGELVASSVAGPRAGLTSCFWCLRRAHPMATA